MFAMEATSMSPASLPDVRSTIGAWLAGAIASVGLLGVTALQCWMYFSHFPRDPAWLKLLVALICGLEIARTTICVNGAYYYAIVHWGDRDVLESPTLGIELIVLLTIVVAGLAHSFFAHQVHSLTRGRYRVLFYVIATFAFADFAFGIASYIAARVLKGPFTTILFGIPAHIATVALCCAIITDWTITGSLVCFLHKNRTRKTRGLMQMLMVYSVNFGLFISLTDLLVLIFANYKWPNINFYAISLFEVIGNLYANTMLASLNSRTLVAEHLYKSENLHFTSINAADISEVFTLEGRFVDNQHDAYGDTNDHRHQQRGQQQLREQQQQGQKQQRRGRSRRRRGASVGSVEYPYQPRVSDCWSSSEGGVKG